jgi:hypothetical protein
VKTFCSKNGVEYELFDNTVSPAVHGYGVTHVSTLKAPERIVGDKK